MSRPVNRMRLFTEMRHFCKISGRYTCLFYGELLLRKKCHFVWLTLPKCTYFCVLWKHGHDLKTYTCINSCHFFDTQKSVVTSDCYVLSSLCSTTTQIGLSEYEIQESTSLTEQRGIVSAQITWPTFKCFPFTRRSSGGKKEQHSYTGFMLILYLI